MLEKFSFFGRAASIFCSSKRGLFESELKTTLPLAITVLTFLKPSSVKRARNFSFRIFGFVGIMPRSSATYLTVKSISKIKKLTLSSKLPYSSIYFYILWRCRELNHQVTKWNVHFVHIPLSACRPVSLVFCSREGAENIAPTDSTSRKQSSLLSRHLHSKHKTTLSGGVFWWRWRKSNPRPSQCVQVLLQCVDHSKV